MIGSRKLFDVLACFLLSCTGTVWAIKCYHCDNSVSPACGRDFKSYQFDATPCRDDIGLKPVCGKQEQPPDRSGWIGVIRSCYYPGDLPGMNESVGCHHYFHDQNNFSALYCFCDTAFCNSAPPTSLTLNCGKTWTMFVTISALVLGIL